MDDHVEILGIIPARYESSRFPGKPLALIKGKPMIQWVCESCSGIFNRLIVATDDQRIMDVVNGFEGESMMTSKNHRSGTERCAEILDILSGEGYFPEFVVNIQGDEPLVKKEQISALVEGITLENADISTLATEVIADDTIENPNIVKAVTDKTNHALYFSRHAIPYYRGGNATDSNSYLRHIGLYAYKAEILKEIVKLPPSKLEIAESLEQLRWLEHGYRIAVRLSKHVNIGIDTPEDLTALEKILDQDI